MLDHGVPSGRVRGDDRTGGAGLTRRRPVTSLEVLCVLLVLALVGQQWITDRLDVPAIQTDATVFVAVCVQALPFLVLGVLISGATAAFVSADFLRRVLPVLAVFLVAPPALGADSVDRTGGNQVAAPSTESDGSELFPALPPGDPIALTLSNFSARAAWDRGHSLDNRTARLLGFVVQEGDDTYVARLAITCCAADAFPVKIKLLGRELSDLPDDSWIEADVTLRPGSATRANEYVPSVTTHSVRSVAQPEDPYEH